jgi:hypothetical protein
VSQPARDTPPAAAPPPGPAAVPAEAPLPVALRLTPLGLRAGVWAGVIAGPAGAPPPPLEVRHLDRLLPGVTLTALADRPGHYTLRVPVPAETLSEGVQTYLVRDGVRDVTLGSFAILAGEALEADIRAEVDLLRAELDLLKRAFRRHVAEG